MWPDCWTQVKQHSLTIRTRYFKYNISKSFLCKKKKGDLLLEVPHPVVEQEIESFNIKFIFIPKKERVWFIIDIVSII